MAQNTHIEWTDHTWNIITGCSIESKGCTNCYAMKLAGGRLKHHPTRRGLTTETSAGPVWNGKTRFNEEWDLQPLSWKKPARIFVCAHSDLFHESVPDEWIDHVFAVMALCQHHTFQVLTKRSRRMRDYLQHPYRKYWIAKSLMKLVTSKKIPTALYIERMANDTWPVAGEGGDIDFPDDIALVKWPLPNVWLGVSAEDQQKADERIPDLLDTPAAARFISAEPLLGPIDLTSIHDARRTDRTDALSGKRWVPVGTESVFGQATYDVGDKSYRDLCPRISWVIVGGESGKDARPMHPDWARSLRDQCKAADVPFLFKQWGEWSTVYDRDFDDPDCRNCPSPANNNERYLNLAGGHGFHGKRVVFIRNIGKKAAGRLLDDQLHNDFPEAPHGR